MQKQSHDLGRCHSVLTQTDAKLIKKKSNGMARGTESKLAIIGMKTPSEHLKIDNQ